MKEKNNGTKIKVNWREFLKKEMEVYVPPSEDLDIFKIWYINSYFPIDAETTLIQSRYDLVDDFLTQLSQLNISLIMEYVERVVFEIWLIDFDNIISGPAFLIVSKDFAKYINLKGSFEWIDKEKGTSTAELSYSKLRLERFIELYSKGFF